MLIFATCTWYAEGLGLSIKDQLTHNYCRKKHLIWLFYMKKKQSRSLKQISFGVIPKEPHFCCNPIGSFLSYVVRMDHLEVPPFIHINLMNGDSLLQKNCWRMSLTQSSRLRASTSKLNELFLCPLINSNTKTPKLNTSTAFDKYPCIIYSGAIYPLLPRNKANMEIRPRSQFSFFLGKNWTILTKKNQSKSNWYMNLFCLQFFLRTQLFMHFPRSTNPFLLLTFPHLIKFMKLLLAFSRNIYMYRSSNIWKFLTWCQQHEYWHASHFQGRDEPSQNRRFWAPTSHQEVCC